MNSPSLVHEILSNKKDINIKMSLKHKLIKRIMCFCDGPVPYYGQYLTAHYKNSEKMKQILSTKRYTDSNFKMTP